MAICDKQRAYLTLFVMVSDPVFNPALFRAKQMHRNLRNWPVLNHDTRTTRVGLNYVHVALDYTCSMLYT